MDRNNLPGLTPIWILVFASILAVLVGLGGEVVNRGIYEFLKDFQGAIIGVVAFSIAYWAAKPVYQQLNELRRQSAVQTFEMLQRLVTNIRSERTVADDFRYHAVRALIFERQLQRADVSEFVVIAMLKQVNTQREDVNRAVDVFRAAQAHPWGDQDTWVLRTNVEAAARQLIARILELGSEVSDFRMRAIAATATWPELTTEARQISLDAEVSAVTQAALAYMGAIDAELARLSPLMERARNGIF